jgi:hypothetical protein
MGRYGWDTHQARDEASRVKSPMYPSRPKLTLVGELPEKMENEDDHRDRIVTYKQKYQPELFMTHGKALECPQNPREADRRWGGTAPENLLPSYNARYATEPTSQRANEPTNAGNPSLSDRRRGEGQQAHQHRF